MLATMTIHNQSAAVRNACRFMPILLVAILLGQLIATLLMPRSFEQPISYTPPAAQSRPIPNSTVAMDIGYFPKPAVATAKFDTSVKAKADTGTGSPEPSQDKEGPFFVVPPLCVNLDGIAAEHKEIVTALKGVIFRSTGDDGQSINIKAFDSSRDPLTVIESDHDKLANVGMVLYPRGSNIFTMTLPASLTYSTISFDLVDVDHGKAKITVYDASGKVLWFTKVGATHTDASITTVTVPEQFVAQARAITINDRDSFGFLPHFGCGSIPQPELPNTAGQIAEEDEAYWASLTPAELRMELMLNR